MHYRTILILTFFISTKLFSQDIAVIQYNGGGDWYANPTALPNLIKFCNDNINTTINKKPKVVSPSSVDLFDYPFVHMTGHGNVYFTDDDAKNLRDYLLSGGFLHIDDNYGMDQYLRKELIKVFPDKKLEEISKNHPLFNKPFPFPTGLPKIHEHNRNRPQAFAIYVEERIVLLYTYESDLGDGWENSEIHNDPQEIRLKALQMGANIINYAFLN
ncbi:DUF4159 domain-containing protein [Flavobacteriaceae bacterium]|nr:DUF4159 domain-containing protein [Flavobacteriaceae bacterium]MDC0858051.1 DUF4159 domain-containing protein [Flavobacteriaceae bacterium]